MLKLLILLVPFAYSSKQNAQDVVAKCSTKKLKLPYEEGIKAVPKMENPSNKMVYTEHNFSDKNREALDCLNRTKKEEEYDSSFFFK